MNYPSQFCFFKCGLIRSLAFSPNISQCAERMPLTCDDQQFEPNLIIAIWYTEQRLTNKQFSSKETDSFENVQFGFQ